MHSIEIIFVIGPSNILFPKLFKKIWTHASRHIINNIDVEDKSQTHKRFKTTLFITAKLPANRRG